MTNVPNGPLIKPNGSTLKSGGKVKKNWIQGAVKDKSKPCTGSKFGGPTCPTGSRKYNLAVTFKKMGKARKGK